MKVNRATRRRASALAIALAASFAFHLLVVGPLYKQALDAPPSLDRQDDERVVFVLSPLSVKAHTPSATPSFKPKPEQPRRVAKPQSRRRRRVVVSTTPSPAETAVPETAVPETAVPEETATPKDQASAKHVTTQDTPRGLPGRQPGKGPTLRRVKVRPSELEKIVLGPGLPLQPSLDRLEGALIKDDQVAKMLAGAMRRPIVSTASPKAYEELGPLVRRIDLAWDMLAKNRFHRSQLSGLTSFLLKMGEGSTAWKEYYSDFYARRNDRELLSSLVSGPDQLKVGEHLEIVVEMRHDERGYVTSVDVTESSGDETFDEQVRLSFLDITSTHDPRSATVAKSRIRLIADSRVSTPKCGAWQGSAREPIGYNTNVGQIQALSCGIDFGSAGFEVPFSAQVSGSVHLEAADMR